MPPINLTATEDSGFFLDVESDAVGPVSGTDSISYRGKAQGPSLDNKIHLGDHATIDVIPPQPYLLQGPVAVNPALTRVRSWSQTFSQASNLARKAILAVVSDTPDFDLSPATHLSAFVTDDNGATWNEYVGPYIWQANYLIWTGVGYIPQAFPAQNIIYGPWSPSDGARGGEVFTPPATNDTPNSPPSPPMIGCSGYAISAAREGSSDDIFTINAPAGAIHDVYQMPYGSQNATDSSGAPCAFPYNNRGFPSSYVDCDYVNQWCCGVVDLHLFKFNLASLGWEDRGQCGEFALQGPGTAYAHGGGGTMTIWSWPEIIGISNGRGICLTHNGSQLFGGCGGNPQFTPFAVPVIPPCIYPPIVGPLVNGVPQYDIPGRKVVFGDPPYSSELVINFSTTGSDHNWSYVVDPTATTDPNQFPTIGVWRRGLPGGSGNSSYGTARGPQPNGDIIYGAAQVDTDAGFGTSFGRFRVMRWPRGNTSEIPIFENPTGPQFPFGNPTTWFGFPVLPQDSTPGNTVVDSLGLMPDTRNTLYLYRDSDGTMGKLAVTFEPEPGDFGSPGTYVAYPGVNRAAAAWVAPYVIPGLIGFTQRLRLRLGWISPGTNGPPSFLPNRPEPIVYEDNIAPLGWDSISGSKVFNQRSSLSESLNPSYFQEVFADRTLGFVSQQQQDQPIYSDARFPGVNLPYWFNGVSQIQFFQIWTPWPSPSGDAYIAGRGNLVLG